MRLQDLIERDAVLVHRSPEPEAPVAERDLHLVEVPDPARAGLPASKAARDHGAELRDPPAQRPVRDLDPALEQRLLDRAQAEREAQVEPDGVGDDRARKRWRLEQAVVSDIAPLYLTITQATTSIAVNVTAPPGRVSFVETVPRDAGDGRRHAPPLEEAELAAWSRAEVARGRPLRLVDLTGTGPLRMGVPSDAVRAASHVPARAWTGAVHAHPAAPDGLLYPSRLTGEPCLAVYDRARDALEARSVRPLLEMGDALADVLDELDIALV